MVSSTKTTSNRVTLLIFPINLNQIVNLYQTDESGEDGYTIDDAATIVSPDWFHGVMSAGKAQKILSNKPEGSFLFRFSSNPGKKYIPKHNIQVGSLIGCYALSVALTPEMGGVAHWRITADNSAGYIQFKVDSISIPFSSLSEIIQKHKKVRLAIKSVY